MELNWAELPGEEGRDSASSAKDAINNIPAGISSPSDFDMTKLSQEVKDQLLAKLISAQVGWTAVSAGLIQAVESMPRKGGPNSTIPVPIGAWSSFRVGVSFLANVLDDKDIRPLIKDKD